MKYLLKLLLCVLFVSPVFAETKTITWMNGDSVYDTTTCTIGGGLYLPSSNPTKSGYNFVGWTPYTKLQYVQNAANTYIDTGIIPQYDDIEMEILFDAVNGSNFLFQSRPTSSGDNITGISGSTTGNTINLPYKGNSETVSSIARVSGNQYYILATFKNGVSTLYVKNMTTDAEDTVTGSYTFSTVASPFCLFGNTGGNRIGAGVHIYYAKMKVNDVYVMNYVPVQRTSDSAIGFVDLVTGEFKAATSGSLIAGPLDQ